jgi:hypothetical protein
MQESEIMDAMDEYAKEMVTHVAARKTLDEIALQFGTDKSSQGHNYTPYYDMFFSPLRDKAITLMEIGIWEGASLKMWEEYFTKAVIWGADIEEKKQYRTPRIATIELNQSSKDSLESFAKPMYGHSVDIIIDDGSHNAEDQILSFKTLFPFLEPGGMYCIEDCLCSYDRERWGKKASVIDYIVKLTGDVNMNGKMSNYHICSNKKEEIKKYDTLNTFERTIEWVFVSCGLCIVKKMLI